MMPLMVSSNSWITSKASLTDQLSKMNLKKHIVLLEMYKQDLKQVQSIFLEGKVLIDKLNENAPLFKNIPPIAGALSWCKSLRDHIAEPLDKLGNIGQGINDREEYKDV